MQQEFSGEGLLLVDGRGVITFIDRSIAQALRVLPENDLPMDLNRKRIHRFTQNLYGYEWSRSLFRKASAPFIFVLLGRCVLIIKQVSSRTLFDAMAF